MKNDTSEHILDYIRENGPVRPSEIARHFSLSTQVIHWHLRKFKAKNLLSQLGKPPHTHYQLRVENQYRGKIPAEFAPSLASSFSYMSPRGELFQGVEAFCVWLKAKGVEKQASSLAKAFDLLRGQIYDGLEKPFSTKARLETILSDVVLRDVFISDFYALPQFGKTHLGNLVHAAKTSENLKFTTEIAQLISADLLHVIKEKKIECICFVPHSIPRRVQFLPELQKELELYLPEIQIKKLFFGDVPVAQKSLSKVSERVANAESTMNIPTQNIQFRRVLIIDDALGSGATLNCVAKKLEAKGVTHVFGYAVVGSYKEFDVISQV